jgi:hypothetical protein
MAQQAGLSESEPLVFFGNFTGKKLKSLTRKILADESPRASCNGHRPAAAVTGSVEPLLSPGGRGAGNGVAARSQLYERSNLNADRRSVPFVGRSHETVSERKLTG